jgi:hypothetical protein
MPAIIHATPESKRQILLEMAFSDIPSKVGKYELRPLSAGSFTLLGRLGNPMMVGKQSPEKALTAAESQSEMFAAAVQYIWVHSAPLEKVTSVECPEDIPIGELKEIEFSLQIGQAFAFLNRYQESALRMTASLAEVEPEEESSRLGKPEMPPVGSPRSSSPAVPAVTRDGSAISSGSCPSSEHSPTYTPPTSPTEPHVDGPSLTLLPDLGVMTTSSETPQS